MKLVSFEQTNGLDALINPALVAAVIVREDYTTIRLSGQAEDIHVKADGRTVREQLEG